VDLNNISDAQFGRIMKASLHSAAQARAAIAKQEQIEADKAAAKHNEKVQREARKQQQALVLKGFIFRGMAVPRLDVREEILDEIAPLEKVAIYNKARTLGQIEGRLDPETTTWRLLSIEHVGLEVMSHQVKEQLVVALREDDAMKRRVAAVMKVQGVTAEEARGIIDRLSR
jgi:hypothetical protein